MYVYTKPRVESILLPVKAVKHGTEHKQLFKYENLCTCVVTLDVFRSDHFDRSKRIIAAHSGKIAIIELQLNFFYKF